MTVIRVCDITLAAAGLIIGFPCFILLCGLSWSITGSPILVQERVGRNLKLFSLFKFRTMPVDVPTVPTHQLNPESLVLSPIAAMMRSLKLDELPQLLNVLLGDMSMVGPRPALPIQNDVISAREKLGVLNHRPGITGEAQILGIDMSTPEKLAKADASMMNNLTVKAYFDYIMRTFRIFGRGGRISHKPIKK